MATAQIKQDQVPDGMAANLPWGIPFEQWTDRMVERGVAYLAGDLERLDGEGKEFFPHILASLTAEHKKRS